MGDLGEWRARIDELDNQILLLLNQRAEAALKIGDLKRRQAAPTYVPEREVEVLRRLMEATGGPLPANAIASIWREIISACRDVEAPLTVSYLGPPATFTHQAALQRFGATASLVPARSISDVFDDVERRRADAGVVPVENSTEGAVGVTLDRLIGCEPVISGELYLEIAQNLLTHARALRDIKRVVSHPQALAQCRTWLATHLRGVPVEDATSTAAAAELAAADATVAAIASDLAAQLYGVPVLERRIEDFSENATRFLVLSRQPAGPTGRDKTSIVFAMRDEPGALYRTLEPCARLGINLSKIESRPSKGTTWKHVSFLDLEGHRDTPAVAAVLAEIATHTVFLKVLGSYPAA